MSNKTQVKVSAPGKIILSGEHAVVYGYPAILCAVDRRLQIELRGKKPQTKKKAFDYKKSGLKNIPDLLKTKFGSDFELKIDSEIPIGCGMGSSAAFSVAVIAGLTNFVGEPWDLAKINGRAYLLEKRHHGNPSGADNTISTYGGFLWFRKEAEGLKIVSSIQIKRRLPSLFLINSGRPKETTKEMVSYVHDYYLKHRTKTIKIFLEIEKATRTLLRYLVGEEEVSFREWVTTSEMLLEELGVVSDSTRQLIRKIEKIGGAAKISGAGGKKAGSGIIIAFSPEKEKLLDFAKKEGLDLFSVKLGEEGARVEK